MANDNFYFSTDEHILRCRGEKSAAFLHGQLSNSIKDLPQGSSNYNLLLTQKGKVRADMYVINQGAYFDLVISPDFFELVQGHLAKLAPLSSCTLSDESANIKIFHMSTDTTSLLPELANGRGTSFEVKHELVFVLGNNRLGMKGYDVFVKSESCSQIVSWFEKNEIRLLSGEEIELLRIKAGRAKVGIDVDENNLPQEALLDQALHYNKGCYLGQEVIARLHFRGHVNRVLARLSSSEQGFAHGEEIISDGKSCGRVTSVAFEAESGLSFLLGYVPVDLNVPGTEFLAAGKKVSVR